VQWFYVVNNAQAGPVDEAQLADLLRTGVITSNTLVWKEGMANWLPYSNALAPAGAPPLPASATNFASAGTRACAQCGQYFPESDVVPLAGAFVCANCKPLALQRMREGSWLSGSRRYAGFWIRLAAVFIDGLILFAVQMVVGLGMGVGIMSSSGMDGMGAGVLYQIISLGISMGYYGYFLSQHGATPGKMALGLQVIRSGGGFITPGRAIGRMFANYLSAIILCIGYIIAAFDSEKRALHDHICDTRVVYKS